MVKWTVTKVVKPIKVEGAYDNVKLIFEILLRVKLECLRFKFKKHFTTCELDSFKAILSNTFLDFYKITF
jgi:hypothetical protein